MKPDSEPFRLAVRGAVARMAEYAAPENPALLAQRVGIPLEQIIKLDQNENPYGPSPLVAEAIASSDSLHIYPDSEQHELRAWIGDYVGLGPEYVLAGNGADELIDLLMRAYLDPGDELLSFTPTFGMYEFDAQQYDAPVIEVERDEQWEIDLERALAALTPRTKLIILCSPNNPTGNRPSLEAVEALLATGRMVLVDEAYVEFSAGPSLVPWVPRHENLAVLRTFSKWAGLAGLRIGYGLFHPNVGRHLWKLRQPFSVNAAAIVAVRESLQDRERQLETCRALIAERERLLTELPKLGYLRPYPSDANFLLCEVRGKEACQLKAELEGCGILVRHYTRPRLRQCLRISVGKPEHTDRLLAALEALKP